MTDLFTRAEPAGRLVVAPARRTSRSPLSRLRTHPLFAPLSIGLLGLLVSVAGSWIPSVWYDEAATISSATRSWPQLFAELRNVDAVHGAYYVLMHQVFATVGYSPFTLRLPSGIAVGVAAALVVVLARQFGRARLGVIAGILFCFLPRVTWMGAEGRSYAITAALAILLTVVFVAASRSSARSPWVAYGVLVVLSCTVFIYLALVVVGHAVVVAVLALRARRAAPATDDGRPARAEGLMVVRRWMRVTLPAGILLLPFALFLSTQKAQVSWILPIRADTIGQVFVTQWFWGTDILPSAAWALIVIGTLSLVAPAVASRFGSVRRASDGTAGVDRGASRGLSLGAVVLAGVFVPTLLLIVISVVYEPLYSPRYLSMSTPFVALAIGAGVELLRRRAFMVVAVAAFVALAVPHVILVQRTPEEKQQSSWSQVADLISAQRASDAPGTVTGIIYGPLRFHATATTRVIEYAYPAAFAGTTDVTLKTPGADTSGLWETHRSLAASLENTDDTDVLYLITSTRQDSRPATEAALEPLGWQVAHTWHFTNVNVLRFER